MCVDFYYWSKMCTDLFIMEHVKTNTCVVGIDSIWKMDVTQWIVKYRFEASSWASSSQRVENHLHGVFLVFWSQMWRARGESNWETTLFG